MGLSSHGFLCVTSIRLFLLVIYLHLKGMRQIVLINIVPSLLAETLEGNRFSIQVL